MSSSKEAKIYYEKFKKEKDRIVDGLLEVDPTGKPLVHWKELKEENIETLRNWFFGFRPSGWGKWKGSGFGVAFWFYPQKGRNLFIEKVRMNIGVESPMKPEFKEPFKTELAQKIYMKKLLPEGFTLYPEAGVRRGGVLLEARYDFNDQVCRKVLEGYSQLSEVIEVMEGSIREYSNKDAFKVPVGFD